MPRTRRGSCLLCEKPSFRPCTVSSDHGLVFREPAVRFLQWVGDSCALGSFEPVNLRVMESSFFRIDFLASFLTGF